VAIYHCRLKVTSQFVRPKSGEPTGATRRSSVAAAAYRSGERLYDNEQGKWCERNSDRLNEVQYTSILAPDGAPSFVFERQSLWNAVERSVLKRDGTTRKPRVNAMGKMVDEGAQLYRECEISLPREVWLADRARAVRMVEDFARREFVSKGMVADVAIHEAEAADGGLNVHAHIMLTMRRLEQDPQRIALGHFFQFKRERDWDCPAELTRKISLANKKRDGALERFEATGDERYRDEAAAWQKHRDALDAERPVKRVRVAWQEAANTALQDVGSGAKIDHRTLKAQREEALQKGDLALAASLDRKPLPRLTPIAKHIKEATGIILDRQNVHRAAAAARRFWDAARQLVGLNGKKRALVFERITEMTDEMMRDWRHNRNDASKIPVVRTEHER
jgi:hypothetical protein